MVLPGETAALVKTKSRFPTGLGKPHRVYHNFNRHDDDLLPCSRGSEDFGDVVLLNNSSFRSVCTLRKETPPNRQHSLLCYVPLPLRGVCFAL